MERKIGEVFQYKGKRYEVRRNEIGDCSGCATTPTTNLCSKVGACGIVSRKDLTPVVIVEAEPHHGFTECLEVDRPGLSDNYCSHCEKQGTDCDCDDEGAGFVADEPCRYDPQSRYYDAGGIEVFEIIKAKLKPEQFRGYLLGNVIKYATRLEHKGQAERDAEKLKRYATWLWETFDV